MGLLCPGVAHSWCSLLSAVRLAALAGSPARSLRWELGAFTALAVDTSQCAARGSRTCRRSRTTVVVAAAHLGRCNHEVASARVGLVTHRLLATSEPQPLASALCSNFGELPESALCSRLWRSASCRCAARGRCCLEVARTRRRPLGLVTRSTPASPMPLRQPPLAAAHRLAVADERWLAPGLRAAVALPPLEPLAAERGLLPLL
jgi:hypothetical protein